MSNKKSLPKSSLKKQKNEDEKKELSPKKSVSFTSHNLEKQFVRRGSVPENTIKKINITNSGILNTERRVSMKEEQSEKTPNVKKKITKKRYRVINFKMNYYSLGLPFIFLEKWLNNFDNWKQFEQIVEMNVINMSTVPLENFDKNINPINVNKKTYFKWLENTQPSLAETIIQNINDWEERNISLFNEYQKMWIKYIYEGDDFDNFESFIKKYGYDISQKNKYDINPLDYFEELDKLYHYWNIYIKLPNISTFVLNVHIKYVLNEFINFVKSFLIDNSKNFKDILQNEFKSEIIMFINKLKNNMVNKKNEEFRNFYDSFLKKQKSLKNKENEIDTAYERYFLRKP